ncbi:hypothetical protein ATER59S_00545 [Aquamicrobium terrae]
MAYLQTKVTTFPALPSTDVTPLEKLILSKVLDCVETDEGFELYTDDGPMNPVVVSQGELSDALNASDRTVDSLLRNSLKGRVIPAHPVENADTETTIFIDLSEFPWQFIVQDIIKRSPTARELVVIQWINDVTQRPDSFGASASLITEHGIFHATSEDLLANFRKRDQVLALEGSSTGHGDASPGIDIVDIHADSPNDTFDALIAAERFVMGFEDDETQDGIADILAGLQAAIRREQFRPALLEALRELRAAAMGFRDDAYRSEPGLRVGNEAVNMLSAALLNAERAIAAAEDRADG